MLLLTFFGLNGLKDFSFENHWTLGLESFMWIFFWPVLFSDPNCAAHIRSNFERHSRLWVPQKLVLCRYCIFTSSICASLPNHVSVISANLSVMYWIVLSVITALIVWSGQKYKGWDQDTC